MPLALRCVYLWPSESDEKSFFAVKNELFEGKTSLSDLELLCKIGGHYREIAF